jgi:hypothetical protein
MCIVIQSLATFKCFYAYMHFYPTFLVLYIIIPACLSSIDSSELTGRLQEHCIKTANGGYPTQYPIYVQSSSLKLHISRDLKGINGI